MSRRFFRPYYVANLLLVFSYTVFRRYLPYQWTSLLGRLGGPAAAPQWEMRVAGVLSLALSINGLKVCPRPAGQLQLIWSEHGSGPLPVGRIAEVFTPFALLCCSLGQQLLNRLTVALRGRKTSSTRTLLRHCCCCVPTSFPPIRPQISAHALTVRTFCIFDIEVVEMSVRRRRRWTPCSRTFSCTPRLRPPS